MAFSCFFGLGTGDRNFHYGNLDGDVKSKVEPAKQIFCEPFWQRICGLCISPSSIGRNKCAIYKLGGYAPTEVFGSYSIGYSGKFWSCLSYQAITNPSQDILTRFLISFIK